MGTENIPTGGSPVERIVSLRPCPFCGNDVNDDEGCFRSGQQYEVRCGNPSCFAHDPCADGYMSAVDRWNRRAADKYERANPLGGPAKIFESVASRVRAGEPLDDVMLDYGLRWTDKAG